MDLDCRNTGDCSGAGSITALGYGLNLMVTWIVTRMNSQVMA